MPEESAKTVLVTGGTGFLGSHLVRSYLGKGARVRVVSRRNAWSGERLGGLELVQVDLRSLDRLDHFESVDLVIHAAGMTRTEAADQSLVREMNVGVTRNVIEACRRARVPRLLHVSSTAAIGISPDPRSPADEEFRFNLGHLDLPYNRTKREAEELVLNAKASDFETFVVNPGFMFGPHGPDFRGREVIERVLRRHLVVCTGGGLSIVHVDDVVDGIHKALECGRPGRRYILSGDNASFCDIARTVRRAAGSRGAVVPVPNAIRDLAAGLVRLRTKWNPAADARLFLDRRYAYAYYSSDAARTELGYAPRSFAAIAREALAHIGSSTAGHA